MPDMETLDILTIKYNTVDTQEADRASKCFTNTTSCQGLKCIQYYTSIMQEADRPIKCKIREQSKSD